MKKVILFIILVGAISPLSLQALEISIEIDISGVVYLSDETTLATSGNGGPCDGSTAVISLRVNGGTEFTTTCSNTDASYSFASVSVNPGDTITLYLNSASSSKANTITITDGSTNITDMDLMVDHIILRSDNSTNPITIADLVDYDNDQDATNMLFDADLGTPNTLITENYKELYINSGDTFMGILDFINNS